MSTKALAAAGATLALALAGCGGDEGGADETADLGRYCELSVQLERSAEEHFSELDEATTRKGFERAHVDFIAKNKAEIDELAAVAPEEIRDEVEIVLAGMRAQAGEEIEHTEAEIDAADERLLQLEKERC